MFRRDPVEALKQSIRDLEDRVPSLNEALSMLKAQVTLAERELQPLQAKERDLVDRIATAVGQDRHDIALNYATALAEVRREVERHARQHEVAVDAFTRAQRHKREFMADKERRIQEAKEALAARRAVEWNEQIAGALELVHRTCERAEDPDDDLVQRLRARAVESEALLARALQDVPDDPTAQRALLAALKRQVDELEERLARTRDQVEALERRLGGE